MVDPNVTGDLLELRAAAWLLEQGFTVFRNVGSTGPADLVVMSPDGTLTALDVKTKLQPPTAKQEAARIVVTALNTKTGDWETRNANAPLLKEISKRKTRR